MSKRTLTLICILLLAVASRLLILAGPAWANFSPITSMALFAGAYFSSRTAAISWTILSIWLANLVLNNLVYPQYYQGFSFGFAPVHMALFVGISMVGSYMLKNRITVLNFLGSNLMVVIGFFLLSNFTVWLNLPSWGTAIVGDELVYSKDWNGLMQCYAMGLPFLKNSLISQFLFSGILFGGFELLKKQIPVLR
ncbi:DUF6580 family putative transport protein [Aquirufa rosea]|uniref:Uncharacterized protein n=1 Tax=Aquirufa rosea TaxID=2509241 RepID=A0A4Q1C1E3_9BACT|nr:DUF6580 family putative transport protein [Aquirufa rosea]RXK50884.1 hypothetical protein ESB04_04330 [Aquirufa rosea]